MLATAARAAARLTAGLWRRWRRPRVSSVVQLDSVRRRLELLLAALYGRTIPIELMEQPAERGWRERVAGRAPRHLRSRAALSASDGASIHLPRELLAAAGDTAGALAHYRVLAVEQAERIVRGTAALAPGEDDRLERDLFLLREGAAVDAAIARTVHGMLPALAAARAAALAQRPALDVLTPTEREVELLVQRVLAADPTDPPAELGAGSTAADSLAWARAMAARLQSPRHRYRGLPAIVLWGAVLGTDMGPPVAASVRAKEPDAKDASRAELPVRGIGAGRDRPNEAGGGHERSTGDGGGDPREQMNGPHGAPTAVAADDGVEGADHDSASDSPARLLEPATGAPGRAREGPTGAGAANDATGAGNAIQYPEWDCMARRYRPRAVTVTQRRPEEVEATWAAAVLREHAVLVRRVRQRFDRLRPRRTRLGQQRDGDELDLAACVRALVDARTGHSADDRLYMAVRPARRQMAIALLVDVSGSTDAQVTKTLQVIDVEKIAVLLASEALDALGDLYTVLTFSGKGAADVRLRTIKDFSERNGELVRRRISALAPEFNTRLGAAIRHATAVLARQPAGHRLLLILSDGRPNDMDNYRGEYGVEDSRQAINEARAEGIYPFCLTVDRETPEYLSRIFGPSGHTILRQPDQLPLALLQVVRHLLGS